MSHLVRTLFTLLTIGCAVLVGGQAEAQVLTFDEMMPSPLQNPILGSVVCANPTGFRFFSNHFHVIGPDFVTDFSSSGTSHLGYESVRGFPITMQREGAGTFSLFSLDAGEFYATHIADHPDAEWITITGYQQDGGVVSHTIVLDGVRDGVGGAPDFEHFLLPNTFVNLRSVVFTGWRQGNVAGGLAIDNLAYQFDTPEVLPACTFVPLPPATPTVSILSPAPGVVQGAVVVEANATDDVGVTGVVFKIDGIEAGPIDTAAPYSFVWDSSSVPDGPHTITAEARDADNNVGTISVAVTVQNAVVVGTGPHYVYLDGADDYVQVADAPALSFGNGASDSPLTIEMWMRADAMTTKHQLIGKWGESTNQEYRLQIAAGSLRLDLRDQSSQALVSAFSNGIVSLTGTWHHIAVTYDGRGGGTAAAGITMYVDGAAIPLWRINHAAYVAMESLSAAVEIGRAGPAWMQYNGGLDDVRLWNVARSAGEIAASMTGELSGAESGLVAYWDFNEGSGLSARDVAAGGATGALINGTQWVAGGPLAPDLVAPVISNVVVANISASSATITFNTDENATGWVAYTPTICPCVEVYSALPGTSHTVTLTALSPDTAYQFEVKAADSAGNVQVAASMSFRTAVQPSDTQPPVAAITSPAPGTVAGEVSVNATASDNVAVASVQFKVDGIFLGAADVTAPYSTSWDSTAVPDGAHTLSVEVRDGANNVATASVVVLVQNQPITSGPHYLDFDGVDDYAQVADAPALSFGNGLADTPMSIEMWFRPDATAKHQLIGKWGESTNQEYRLLIAAGTIRFDLRDQSSQGMVSVFTGGVSALQGGWHHLAVTYDGRGGAGAANGITVYIDGVAVPATRVSDPAYVAMESLAAPIEIGRVGPSWNQYNGGLDELRLWNVHRSVSEIRALMASELTGTESGLVAYWRFNEGSGNAVADDAPSNHTATLFNNPAWVAGGPLAPDTFPPDISNIAVANVTSASATIGFNTNEPTSGWVSYTTTNECPCIDVHSVGVGTTHVIDLAGLAAGTVYRVFAKASDAANNVQTAPAMTFQTLAASADTQAPAVTIVSPAAGTASGTFTLEATALDNVAVTEVQFAIDGAPFGAADVQPPYSVVVDSTALAEGAHAFSAQARDAAGNIGAASVIVTVRNQPVNTSPRYIELDGTDDYVQVADAPALSFGSGVADTPLTIEMWLRPDTVGKNQLIGKWGDSAHQEYRLFIGGGTIRVDLRDQSSQGLASAFTRDLNAATLVGAWHHLAVTYDGRGGATAADGISIYLDGVPLSLWRVPDARYVAMESLAAPVQIGREGPFWNQFNGGLDELRIWNVVRSAGEITGAMAGEVTGAEAGLVAYWRFNEGAGTIGADDSPLDHTATLQAGASWMPGGPLAPDTLAPDITNVVVSNVTATGATISFNTNEPATGWVSFSTGASCPCTDVYSVGVGTTHVITLSGLSADTEYRFEARASDAGENLHSAAAMNFRTLVASTDILPPVLNILTPASGTVSGIVIVDVTAADNVGVVDVELRVDGVTVGGVDANAPFAFTWDSTVVPDGAHTLSVLGRDTSNNIGTASVAVVVQNAPTASAPHFVEFDGVDDYARVADAPALSFGNGAADAPFSIEMWIRPDSASAKQQLIGKWGESTNQEYRVLIAAGTIRVDLRDQSTRGLATVFTSGLNLSSLVGTWHHLAVTYDGRGGSTAANGISVAIDAIPVSLTRVTDSSYVAMESLAAPVEIAREGPFWNQFNGALDELRLWNVARTQNEIQGGMGAELTGVEAGLVGYWRFNEGSGATVADDSPLHHPASLPVAPLWLAGGPLVP